MTLFQEGVREKAPGKAGAERAGTTEGTGTGGPAGAEGGAAPDGAPERAVATRPAEGGGAARPAGAAECAGTTGAPAPTDTAAGTGTAPRRGPLVRRNDYAVLEPPALGRWEPVLSVSVVVPAFGGQSKLDLVLASLAAQSYPSRLLDVVVVDDGSTVPLRLPELCPRRTRLVRAPGGGWGPGHAFAAGVAAASGDVVLRLDADVVAGYRHVESHMRWHHTADHLAVIGHLRYVEDPSGTVGPHEVFDAVAADAPERLFDGPGEEMRWLRRAYDATRNLRSANSSVHGYFIGATGSVRRDFYAACGGTDTGLALGEDTHLGYRLAQGGAVFVPEQGSSAWHMGRPQMEERKEEGVRFRRPFVGNRMPVSPAARRSEGRQWQVPLVDVVVEAHGFDATAATVDSLLAGQVTNIRITLVGGRESAEPDRHGLMEGPGPDLRLLREHYRCEPRVRMTPRPPYPDPDVPYRLSLRPGHTYAPHAVDRMVTKIDRARAGLLRATVPGDDLGGPRLERTAAYARARRVADGADPDSTVALTHGLVWIDGYRELIRERGDRGGRSEAPRDWARRLEAVRAETGRHRARADRLSRLYAWLTRSRGGRLLCGRRRRGRA